MSAMRPGTGVNDERGATLPAWVLLRFLEHNGAGPYRLLSGEGYGVRPAEGSRQASR